jgi:NTP pyrophosphatase (non-canonical NTP hydrolase)
LLIVLTTSPRVAPGLLSWPAWQALGSAVLVLAPAGHPQLPALEAAGIACRVAEEPGAELAASDELVVWLPVPGADPALPAGAQLLQGSADLPGAHLIDLVATMDRLRVDCPWDARQTHQSLAPHLLEEPYEALEALESGDEQALCEELGDVALQVVFHARIAAEREDGTGFTIDDVADGIVAKLIRRHPHVFGDVTVSGPDEVRRNWDEIKREEKRARAERQGVAAGEQPRPSALDGVPFGQPALALAAQLQRRAVRPRRARTMRVRTSAVSCSGSWPGPVSWGLTPRWSCAPPRAAIAIACAPGSFRSTSGAAWMHFGLLRYSSLSVMYVASGLAVICHDKLRPIPVNRWFWLRVSYSGVLRRLERERGKCRVSVVLPMGG